MDAADELYFSACCSSLESNSPVKSNSASACAAGAAAPAAAASESDIDIESIDMDIELDMDILSDIDWRTCILCKGVEKGKDERKTRGEILLAAVHSKICVVYHNGIISK